MDGQAAGVGVMTPAARRAMVARELGDRHDGLVRRDQLYELGLTYDQVLAEIRAGRWHQLGRRTISLAGAAPAGRARWWLAVWETGSGAVLDGVSSLMAAGLTAWEEKVVHVSVGRGTRVRKVDGVRVHRHRDLGRVLGTDPPRTAPETAVLRAAQWAVSDRQALTVLAMTVQQRLVHPGRLLESWSGTTRHARRRLLDEAVPLVCDGAQALGELDFARACRRRGLPEPSRQAVRRTPDGLCYLDVWFDAFGVHVEINGAQHYAGLTPVADARRRNHRALEEDLSIEIPVLGLLVDEAGFVAQVEEALRRRGWEGRAPGRSAAPDVRRPRGSNPGNA